MLTYFTVLLFGVGGMVGIGLILESLRRIEAKLGTEKKKEGE